MALDPVGRGGGPRHHLLLFSLFLSNSHHQNTPRNKQKKTKTPSTTTNQQQGPGKKWESTPLTANGKPVFQTVHVKTGDTVQVIAGSDKGKVGVVSKVLLKTGQVVVEGVNVKVRSGRWRWREKKKRVFFLSSQPSLFFFFSHQNPPLRNFITTPPKKKKKKLQTKTVQPKSKDETGRLVQTESPIHSSNVMAYSKEKQVRSRIGHKTGADGKKVRVLLKTGEELP